MSNVTDTPAWQKLAAHHDKIKDVHLRDLFAEDAGRAAKFTVEGAGLTLDYSKQRITEQTVALLAELAKERKVAERRDAMFRGDKINVSEDRAVLHVALRAPRGEVIETDGHDVVPDVHASTWRCYRHPCCVSPFVVVVSFGSTGAHKENLGTIASHILWNAPIVYTGAFQRM